MWPWNELGLPGPADLTAVRRAYAQRLKITHPEEDPEGFQRLHAAYQEARRLARQGDRPPFPPPELPREERPAPEQINKESFKPDRPVQDGTPDRLERVFLAESLRQAEERERRMARRREDFFARNSDSAPAQARWARLEAALTVIEELSDSGAAHQEWVAFLHSGVFLPVKGDEELVAGLEEFLRQTPDLEGAVRQELVQAFGLRKRDVPPEWQGLRELLTGIKPQQPEPPPPPKPLYKRWRVRLAVIFLVFIVGIPLAARQIREVRERPVREAQAQMCQYLEEDLGRRMESHWDGKNYENLYSPWDEPGLFFRAWPDGERDLAAGKPGYTTNYGNVVLTQAMERFNDGQRTWSLKNLEEGGVSGIYGSSPGGYLFQVSIRGEDEGVAALGALLESLQAERWYQACQPEFTLQLALFGLPYYTYTSGELFSAAALLDYYQNQAGPDLCLRLVEESGLAREDFAGAAYRLEKQGTVELDGRSCFLVSGVDAGRGDVLRQYLFEGTSLTSFPAEEFSLELKHYQRQGGDIFHSSWAELPRYIQIYRK